jgi:Spinocerebellar ataxia type 10 protein domain
MASGAGDGVVFDLARAASRAILLGEERGGGGRGEMASSASEFRSSALGARDAAASDPRGFRASFGRQFGEEKGGAVTPKDVASGAIAVLDACFALAVWCSGPRGDDNDSGGEELCAASLRGCVAGLQALSNIIVGLRQMDEAERGPWVQAVADALVPHGLGRLIEKVFRDPSFLTLAAAASEDSRVLQRVRASAIALLYNLGQSGDAPVELYMAWMTEFPESPSFVAEWALDEDGEGREWAAFMLSALLTSRTTNKALALPLSAALGMLDDPVALSHRVIPMLQFLLSELEQVSEGGEEETSGSSNLAEGILDTAVGAWEPLSGILVSLTTFSRVLAAPELARVQTGICGCLDVIADACQLSTQPDVFREDVVNDLVGSPLLSALLVLLDSLNTCDGLRGVDSGHSCRTCALWSTFENGKQRVLRCMSNITFQNRRAQDAVREFSLDGGQKNGIHVLLDGTRAAIDDERLKFVREWGILAVRNACEGNEENQAVVDSLQVQNVVQDDALADAGLEVRRMGSCCHDMLTASLLFLTFRLSTTRPTTPLKYGGREHTFVYTFVNYLLHIFSPLGNVTLIFLNSVRPSTQPNFRQSCTHCLQCPHDDSTSVYWRNGIRSSTNVSSNRDAP